MRHLILISSILFLLANCKSKKKNSKETVNAKRKSENVSGKKTVPHAKSELEIAQSKWPGTSENDLKEGKTIFETKCTRCHASKEIVTRTEENWRRNIDKMAPKAKLSAEEKDKLTKYVLSYLEAHTSRD